MDRFTDKLLNSAFNLLCLIMAFMSVGLMMFYFHSNMSNFVDVSEQINTYSPSSYVFASLLIPVFLTSILMLVNALKSSNSSNFSFERKLGVFFNGLQVISNSKWMYRLFITAFFMTFNFAIINSVILLSNDISHFQEFDLIAMKVNDYYHFAMNSSIVVISILVFLSVMILITESSKENEGFVIGLALLSFVLNFLLNGFTDNGLIKMVFSLLDSDFNYHFGSFFKFDFIGMVNIFCMVGLSFALALFIYSGFKRKKLGKNLIVGYLTNIVSTAVVAIIIYNSSSLHYFKNNPNIVNVNVLGNNYTINQDSILSVMPFHTESLIKAYSGLTIHNSMLPLEFLLSDSYEGDKEQAIKLVADIALNNMQKYEAKRNGVIDILTTRDISLSSAINVVIPFITVESSPLSHQERALKAITNGEYQLAVDYYLEDAINNKDTQRPSIKFNEGAVSDSKGSFGQSITQSLISSLVYNNLAKIDYDLVVNDKVNDLKERIKPVTAYKTFGDDEVKEWLTIFKAERFL